jgi:hypothetical protein
MSDTVQLALIASMTTVIPSALATFFSYRASVHSKKAAELAEDTRRNTDGMKDELVNLTAKASHAEGVLEGKLGKHADNT